MSNDPDRFLPGDGAEATRWRETRRRKRMLTGEWESDLREAMREHLAATRNQNLGKPVLAVNLLKSVASQLAEIGRAHV